MIVNVASRRIAPFPDMPVADQINKIEDHLYELYRGQSSGLIIYGGPGSGTTRLLNYLAENLNEMEGALALGPYGMSQYRGQINPERIWRDLARQIVNDIAGFGINILNPNDQWSTDLTVSEVREIVGTAFEKAIEMGFTRLVLLLDDFDDTHPRAAVSIANQIRALYDQHKRKFSFVLVAESDLEMLRTTQHVYSPLDGVSDSFHLLDLEQTEMNDHAKDYYANLAKDDDELMLLTPEDLDQLWFFTRGYPALVNAFLRELYQGRIVNSEYSLQDAKEICLKKYTQIEPLKTGIRELERLANLNARGFNPANLLYELASGHVPYDPQDRQVRMLLAMGILGWRGDVISWRNEFLRQFWEQYERGKYLLASWVGRPQWFQKSELSGQGKIYVDLFLDLGDFLDGGDFDQKRGTQRWLKGLRELADMVDKRVATEQVIHEGDKGRNINNVPYTVWKDQQRLINIGHDLNIFRGKTIRKSFMPIYQMDMESFETQLDQTVMWLIATMPDSFGDEAKQGAQDLLKNEWNRWSNVRLQLTRDGSVHITFVREINDPLPLMQIMHELLGLERELDGGGPLEMSVQWELALIAIMAFIWQVSEADGSIPELDIQWQDIRPRSATEEIYPLRDRYVIYQLQKVCNCRFQGLRPKRERRIIDLDKLDDLLQSKRLNEELQRPFNYASELSTLLEGVMVGRASNNNNDGRSGIFPPLTLREVKQFLENDLSSWQNEYAATTLDNALLIFQTRKKAPVVTIINNQEEHKPEFKANDWCQVCQEYEQREIEDIYFPERTVAYEDYWQCLILGLSYVVELRWSGQWIAWRTTEELDKLARQREKHADGLPSKQSEALTHTVALTTRLLAHLRDAAIPMFMAGADYAARKYQRLIEVSGLLAAINNAEENIRALNAYLYYSEQQRMQKTIAHDQKVRQQRSEETAKIVGIIGGVLAVLTMFIALPSMWIDFGPDTAIGNFISALFNRASRLIGINPEGNNIALKYMLLCLSTLFIIFILVGAGILYLRYYLHKDDDGES